MAGYTKESGRKISKHYTGKGSKKLKPYSETGRPKKKRACLRKKNELLPCWATTHNPFNTVDMKAFMIYAGWPQDGCILCFAETRNKARHACTGILFEWEYAEMSTKRVPDYDKYAEEVGPAVIETNDDLPKGAPPFYRDIDW